MSDCCNEVLFVGCFGSCQEIPLLVNSLETGAATLEFTWLGKKYFYGIVLVEGEQVVIPNIFNEMSTVTFKIKLANGEYLQWFGIDSESNESEGYECFMVKNQMQISLSNISQGSVPPVPGLNLETTLFNMNAEEDTVNIGVLAFGVYQLFINGVLQTSPLQYTVAGSVVTIVDPPFDDYVVTILNYSYA